MRRAVALGLGVAVATGAAALALLPADGLLAGAARQSPSTEPGFTRGVHDGRQYRQFVPASTKPRRLVVALHGCWQTPDDFARGTRLNEAAEPRGLVVLYPMQERRSNANRCWNWFEPRHKAREGGETAEILALTERLQHEHGIGAERAVVLGLSAGGFMAVNLACAAPDVVGGVGVAAGGPFSCGTGVDGALRCMLGQGGDGVAAARRCLAAMGPRRRPVRASLWHGTSDSVVSPDNLDALAEMFRTIAGTTRATTATVDGVRHTVSRDRDERAVLETWLVPGMGHAWSGGDARGTLTFPAGPDATNRMLDFLLGE